MADPERHAWLPDFCRLPRVAAVLGIAELVVLVVFLAPARGQPWTLEDLVAASALAQWIALVSALLLCRSRHLMANLPLGIGLLAAAALPTLVGAIGAWGLRELDMGLGVGLTRGIDHGGRFIFGIALLSGLIGVLAMRYFYVREQWQAQVEAHAKAAVDALQARIRPHFLFNSMNTIASLVRSDPATAERAVEDLADLFRAALGADRGDSTLAEEIELARRYLDIEALRLGPRLRVRWHLPEPLPTLRLPRLVLQPLLENAVLHGISHLAEGGEIDISARVEPGWLRLGVRNPAPPVGTQGVHNGHALASIEQRLRYRFGPAARLDARREGNAFSCLLSLPMP